jgi:hypothetical protein
MNELEQRWLLANIDFSGIRWFYRLTPGKPLERGAPWRSCQELAALTTE